MIKLDESLTGDEIDDAVGEGKDVPEPIARRLRVFDPEEPVVHDEEAIAAEKTRSVEKLKTDLERMKTERVKVGRRDNRMAVEACVAHAVEYREMLLARATAGKSGTYEKYENRLAPDPEKPSMIEKPQRDEILVPAYCVNERTRLPELMADTVSVWTPRPPLEPDHQPWEIEEARQAQSSIMGRLQARLDKERAALKKGLGGKPATETA
jgi:hypothetical protein